MKNTFGRSIIIVIFLAVSSSCGNNSAPQSGSAGSAAPYKLFQVASQSEPAGNGLVNYTVQIGIENTSDKGLGTGVSLGKITLQTEEGYTYQLGDSNQVHWYLDVWDGCQLPPSFRKASDTYTFEIGETLHPTAIEFGNYGVVSLTSGEKIEFPTSKPDSAFLDFPQTVNAEDITLTLVGNPQLENEYPSWRLGIDVELYNSNPAETRGGCVGLTIFDRFGACHNNQAFCNVPETGPLQTSRSTIWLDTDVSWNEDISVAKDILRGAKLEVDYNNGVFDEVFNLSIP